MIKTRGPSDRLALIILYALLIVAAAAWWFWPEDPHRAAMQYTPEGRIAFQKFLVVDHFHQLIDKSPTTLAELDRALSARSTAELEGFDLIEYAGQAGKPEVVALLVKRGLSPDGPRNDGGPLILAAGVGDLRAIKTLLANGANLHRADEAAMYAIDHVNPHPEITHYLLALGADPNAHDEYRNLLTRAVMNDDVALVKELLARGARVEPGRGSKETPLGQAHDPKIAALLQKALRAQPRR